jgi:small subunit ribosomal protein S6
LAANVYEGMFILDSTRFARDPQGTSGLIEDMIKKHGGEILASRLWEERRLAYPIDGHRKGTYWLTYFRLDSNHVAPIHRECQISESVIRMLVLKVDPRIVDALVAHALSTVAGTGQGRAAAPVAAAPPVGEPVAVAVGAGDDEIEELNDDSGADA